MHEHYHVSVKHNTIEICGAANQTVRLDSEGYFHQLFALPSPYIQQFVSIAAAIYAIDKICKRKTGQHKSGGIRQLHITFHISNAHFWLDPIKHEMLIDLLSTLTDDDWQIDFNEVSDAAELPRHQSYLNFQNYNIERVALYSGGLDSAAGLAHQITLNKAHNYLLVTVGHYHGLHARVQRQLAALSNLLIQSGSKQNHISHSTLTTHLKGGKSVRIRAQETSQRSRALLFCAAAMSAANVFKINSVEIFENGVGSINLPVMTGMLGNGRATRGAHPAFLKKMSVFASMILNEKFEFILPFKNHTKGEVLGGLKSISGMSDWLALSISCIHTSPRVPGQVHCGECPACIERRQAFTIANMPPNIDHFQIDVTRKSPTKAKNKEYLNLYRLDALRWHEDDHELRRRLEYHLAITDAKDVIYDEVVELYKRHSCEVTSVFGSPYHSI